RPPGVWRNLSNPLFTETLAKTLMTESRRIEGSSRKFVQFPVNAGQEPVCHHHGPSADDGRTVLLADILPRLATSAVPVESSTCGGCHGCGVRFTGTSTAVRLAGTSGKQIELDLPVAARYELLWNSWLKPLVALLVTATLCSLLGLPDGIALGLAMGSMTLGIMLCRPLPAAALTIRKMT
ncbi:MAG: SoxR reducing system RseC family protein, partial [Proteobacteria bacterium]|nr:SoxR reducing system RseC family protein [Pseudomonadota bacterium]